MVEFRTGFTAPSVKFPGAAISLECTRYFDGGALAETTWAVNVMNADSTWVPHPYADHVQTDLDSVIAMLAPFCDGQTEWTSDQDGRVMSLFEMILATWPDDLTRA